MQVKLEKLKPILIEKNKQNDILLIKLKESQIEVKIFKF